MSLSKPVAAICAVTFTFVNEDGDPRAKLKCNFCGKSYTYHQDSANPVIYAHHDFKRNIACLTTGTPVRGTPDAEEDVIRYLNEFERYVETRWTEIEWSVDLPLLSRSEFVSA